MWVILAGMSGDALPRAANLDLPGTEQQLQQPVELSRVRTHSLEGTGHVRAPTLPLQPGQGPRGHAAQSSAFGL